MNIQVSVIIPCYNCADLIGETLESLERQTYKNFEVVCVNDGSTDNTLQVLNGWKDKQTINIRVVNQLNGGVSKARNHGLAVASAEYVLFLDADDSFHDDFIFELLTATEKNNVDAAYCRLNRDRNQVMHYVPEMGKYKTKNQIEAMHDLLYRMGEFSFFCYIYKNNIIKEHQILFDENTKFGEDREFVWKYLCHCETAVLVDMPLYWYRVNLNSAIQNKASWRRTDSLKAVKRTEGYLKARNCSFYDQYADYCFARDMWAVAKKFAVSKDKELFVRLQSEYDVKPCMKRTAKDHHKLVALASVLYLIHPMLFYYAIGFSRFS